MKEKRQLICWRPLVFWDEEQIKQIEIDKNLDKVRNDDDFKDLVSQYRKVESKIDELTSESESIYCEIKNICGKKWIPRDMIWRLT